MEAQPEEAPSISIFSKKYLAFLIISFILYFILVENVLVNKYEDTMLIGGNSNEEKIPAFVKKAKRNKSGPKPVILPGISIPKKIEV